MMVHTLIQQRLQALKPESDLMAVQAAKQALQELALLGLSRAGFFKVAAFQGGTALRIFYGLDRFSEDLDFSLQHPDSNFRFEALLQPLITELTTWGVEAEWVERSKAGQTVQKAFLKNQSLGVLLNLKLPFHPQQKLKVKLELDINPPAGAKVEQKLCQFPTDFYVTCYDRSTLFAGKVHALLCRNYVKGRDWYDFAYFVGQGASINLDYLSSALRQTGPYLQQVPLPLEITWVEQQLVDKVKTIDFEKTREDVLPFVRQIAPLTLWSTQYFLDKVALFLCLNSLYMTKIT